MDSRSDRGTVLVVEDQPEVRAMMVRTLSGEGYRVLEASDGREALKVLAAEAGVQLVVTDVVMPRMDGLELAQKLAAFGPIPILFTSGYGQRRTELPGPFLEKPFGPGKLAAAVERLRLASAGHP